MQIYKKVINQLKEKKIHHLIYYILGVITATLFFIFLKIKTIQSPFSLIDIANIIGNISQALLVVIGCFVFLQIKTAKNDLQTRCKRESLSKSMDISENYAKELLPMIDNFNVKFKECAKGHHFLEYNLSNYYESEIRPEDRKAYDSDILFYSTNHLCPECIKILNYLEAFAMNFMQGVADEKSVFSALSQTYCGFVKEHAPLICRLRNPKFNIYLNLVGLHQLWYTRIKENGLKIQEKNLKEELDALTSVCPETPIPVGTK